MRKAFTLIEVLVGLTLLALVVSIIQGVYAGVSRSRRASDAQTEGVHAAALLLQKVSDELATAFTFSGESGAADTRFVVQDDGEGSSRLEFTASLPEYAQVQAEEGESGGALARISYAVLRESDGSLSLVRAENRDLEEGLDSIAEPDRIVRGIVRFRIQCSTDGKEWKEAWDSEAEDPESPLPKVVALELTWHEGGASDGPERMLRTSIPIYRSLG